MELASPEVEHSVNFACICNGLRVAPQHLTFMPNVGAAHAKLDLQAALLKTGFHPFGILQVLHREGKSDFFRLDLLQHFQRFFKRLVRFLPVQL